MSKLNIGVGDDFPVEDAPASGHHKGHSCGNRRAHWEKRRAYWAQRQEARRERWRQWCAFWHGTPKEAAPPARQGDASYTDVPPRKDGEA